MNLTPPFRHLYHVNLSPSSFPGQKVGQDRSLLMSLDRLADNDLGTWLICGHVLEKGNQADGEEDKAGVLALKFEPLLLNIWVD